MQKVKSNFLYLMALGYILAGILHFINPAFYLNIMPPYIPFHLKLVYLTGVCEIIVGVLLLPLKTRRVGAWLLIALLIAIYPANIQMAINYWQNGNPDLWIALVRLPIQFILIWLAWIYKEDIKRPTF